MKRFGAQIIAATIALALLLPLCGILFGCGCTLAAGLKHCNIHDPAPPNCPWCSGSLASQFLPVVIILVAAISGPTLMRKISGATHFARELAAGLIAAMLAMFLLAWVYALVTDYSDFFLMS